MDECSFGEDLEEDLGVEALDDATGVKVFVETPGEGEGDLLGGSSRRTLDERLSGEASDKASGVGAFGRAFGGAFAGDFLEDLGFGSLGESCSGDVSFWIFLKGFLNVFAFVGSAAAALLLMGVFSARGSTLDLERFSSFLGCEAFLV